MTRIRVLFGAANVVAVVGIFWGSVSPASACSCVAETASPRDRADTVVIGTVVRMAKSDAIPAPGVLGEDLDAVIAVEEYLKGAGPTEIVADDPAHGGTCAYFDESSVGRRYVVYLSGEAEPFRTSYCAGNYELPAGDGDDKPTPTVVSAPPPIEQPPDPPGWDARATPQSYFGHGTPAPGPVAASAPDPPKPTHIGDAPPAGAVSAPSAVPSESSSAEGIAARFDQGGGDPPTSRDLSGQLDGESDVGLVPILASIAAPVVFLVGATFLWRRRVGRRMGNE